MKLPQAGQLLFGQTNANTYVLHQTAAMKTSPFDRLPFFVNLENLGEDDEIRIDYDDNGNPVRIRKMRKDDYSWIGWLIVVVIVLAFWTGC